MRTYISYSHGDSEFVQRLVSRLREESIDVWIDKFEFSPGDNIINKVLEGIHDSSHIVVVLSPSYTESKWTAYELGAFVAKETEAAGRTVIPILIEDCDVPIFVRDRQYIDFRKEFEAPLQHLVSAIRQPTGTPPVPSGPTVADSKSESLEFQVRAIKSRFATGEVSFFLGAGVSIAAKVPSWNTLLRTMLTRLFGKQLPHLSNDLLYQKYAEIFQTNFNPSAVMIAQYLKNGLGNAFLETIRTALYAANPQSCQLIDAIVELCRPQRNRETLHSIVTFNFDALIEENLTRNNIKHHAIFAEGQRPSRAEFPIYHVHGYLPRTGPLTADNEIVFSEDAYHSQFIDPFSWSNVTQLTHLNQQVCVFVGLSVTDPNLRRLLDIARRRNPSGTLTHYCFKKRYGVGDVFSNTQKLEIEKELGQDPEEFITLVHHMEEQDAKNLGLNIIWVDDYGEISDILKRFLDD